MAGSPHQVTDIDAGPTGSLTSTPRSDHYHNLPDDGAAAQLPRVRFMCSFGGEIHPRPHDNQLRYVGGDTRIVVVHRHTTFASLLSKLAILAGTTNISIKYQLPHEDLDALITVTADDDVENMMEEYDRIVHSKTARLRLFLFDIDETSSRGSSITSILDGSSKRENWFVDALNGCPGSGPVLERNRSEVSSIVSELPDYLFGLDNQDDDGLFKEPKKRRNKNLLNDTISISDPGSPAPVVSSPFGSTPSPLAPPSVQVNPNLPPVKTKPVTSIQVLDNTKDSTINDKMDTQQPVYPSDPGPIWHYPNPAMQPIPAVYYVPSGHQVRPGNVPVPNQAQFVQPYQFTPGRVPVAYPRTISSVGQVYGPGMSPYEMNSRVIQDNTSPTTCYAARARSLAVISGGYPGIVAPGGEAMPGARLDMGGGLSQGPW